MVLSYDSRVLGPVNVCGFFFFFGCSGFSLLHTGFSLFVESGISSSLQCTNFSLWWLLLLPSTGSGHMVFSGCSSWSLEHRLNSCEWGLSCSLHVRPFQTRDQTHVSCIGRQILYHWVMREALKMCFMWRIWPHLLGEGRVPCRRDTYADALRMRRS